MRTIKYTARFKRDYKREKAGRHGKTLDTVLMAVVDLLAIDAEHQPPIARHRDSPLALALAHERMQLITGNVHVQRALGGRK